MLEHRPSDKLSLPLFAGLVPNYLSYADKDSHALKNGTATTQTEISSLHNNSSYNWSKMQNERKSCLQCSQ